MVASCARIGVRRVSSSGAIDGRHLGRQRHLDEDQRLVGELGMEEGEAAPVGWLKPIAQIDPSR